MARPAQAIPGKRLNTVLPPEVATRLELYLFSELEGRVPHGAYQEFLGARIREFFDNAHLDLGPFIGELPGTFIVSGNPNTINRLINQLRKEQP